MNKDFLVDGKELISASRAAKKLGYAQDYIGELARSGKVPGRLIGRSWYVEVEALLAHKKARHARGRSPAKLSTPGEEKARLGAAREFIKPHVVSERGRPEGRAPILNLNKDELRALPALEKEKKVLFLPDTFSKAVVTLLSLFVIFASTLYSIKNISPRSFESVQAKALNDSLYASSNTAGEFGNYIWSNIKNIFVHREVEASRNSTGIVVVPNSANGAHDAVVNQVKDAFSDPVNVMLDPEGDSGVVHPVFTSGSGEDYAFVLVPVKPAKK